VEPLEDRTLPAHLVITGAPSPITDNGYSEFGRYPYFGRTLSVDVGGVVPSAEFSLPGDGLHVSIQPDPGDHIGDPVFIYITGEVSGHCEFPNGQEQMGLSYSYGISTDAFAALSVSGGAPSAVPITVTYQEGPLSLDALGILSISVTQGQETSGLTRTTSGANTPS
jgi:hypothetical protein